MQRKRSALLSAKPTQASALTHDSNLNENSLGEEQCHLSPVDATHHGTSSGNMWGNVVKIMVKVLNDLSKGDSRSVGYCGRPWQTLGTGLLNGIFLD